MVVDSRYPHKFVYSEKGSDGGYNEDTGSYDEPTQGVTHTLICRARPNYGSSGREVRYKDGTLHKYAFDLGFPLGTQQIPEYTIATIIGLDGEELYKGELLRFQLGVHSIRGWI